MLPQVVRKRRLSWSLRTRFIRELGTRWIRFPYLTPETSVIRLIVRAGCFDKLPARKGTLTSAGVYGKSWASCNGSCRCSTSGYKESSSGEGCDGMMLILTMSSTQHVRMDDMRQAGGCRR